MPMDVHALNLKCLTPLLRLGHLDRSLHDLHRIRATLGPLPSIEPSLLSLNSFSQPRQFLLQPSRDRNPSVARSLILAFRVRPVAVTLAHLRRVGYRLWTGDLLQCWVEGGYLVEF